MALLKQRRERKKLGVRHLVLLVLLGLAVFFGYNKYISMNVDKANAFLATGEYDSAARYFKRVVAMPMSNGQGEDGLGAVALLDGDREAARARFKSVLAHKPRRISGKPALILKLFLDEGAYDRAQIYVDFLKNWKQIEDLKPLSLDFAAVALGTRNLEEAAQWLERASSKAKASQRFQSLDKLQKEFERSQQVPVLLDRLGNPICNFDLKEQKYVFTSDNIFTGWERGEEGDPLAKVSEGDRFNQISTTVDLNLQKAAFQAMKGYEGTMILTNPNTGEILAAYATDGYDPFNSLIEPGSVIKVLTYGLLLENGGQAKDYEPHICEGNTSLSGKIFYDWTRHGKLATVDQAMAESCNLLLAQMAQDLSLSKWLKGAKKLFDGEQHPGYLGEGVYGIFEKEPEDAWTLGKAAIGLNHIKASSLGLVLIPMAVANKGELARPRLIQHYANLEGHVYKDGAQPPMDRLFAEPVAEALMSGMKLSVADEKGTARRARVDFVETAMKTGTSGDRPLNSVMIGTFPAAKPKVAFAFFLDKGGKCELNGARVAKRLLEQMKALAPEYLE